MSTVKTIIPKSGAILGQLRFNNCKMLALLSEFIDNIAAELEHCKTAEVVITIGGEWVQNEKEKGKSSLNLSSAFLEITDNATGIALNRLEECLSLACCSSSKASLHEHGIGMKTAIVSLGELDYLITKVQDEPAYRINQLLIGEELSVFADDSFIGNSGTTIRLKNLSTKVYKRKEDYITNIITQLGARYSRLLSGNALDGKKLSIKLRLVDEFNNIVSNKNGQSSSWDIVPISPLYKNNRPEIDLDFKGSGKDGDWCAHLEFGFAPEEEELKQYNKKIEEYSPYHRWSRKVQVVMHDRILCEMSADEIGANKSYGQQRALFIPYIGVLTLRYGFKTSMNKDGVFTDENWSNLIAQIKEKINPVLHKCLNSSKNAIEEDESFYRDELASIQKNGEERDVQREQTCPGSDGRIDLLVDNEVWELKAKQACGQDVYQCLFYIDTADSNVKQETARLIAPSFSDGAYRTVKILEEKRNVKVKLKTFADVGLSGKVKQD